MYSVPLPLVLLATLVGPAGCPSLRRAGVVLPKSFAAEPKKRYPVVYEIPGFGGNHFFAFQRERTNATEIAGIGMIWVVLDPDCRMFRHPNVFVVDGSFLPTSLGVGPALTIMANALRVAAVVAREV